jgi:hypothetical protein
MYRLVDTQTDGCYKYQALPYLLWKQLYGTFFTSTPLEDNTLNVLERTSQSEQSLAVYWYLFKTESLALSEPRALLPPLKRGVSGARF